MPKQRLRSFTPTSFKTSSGDSRYISDRIIIIHTFILPLICLSRSWEIEVPAFFTHTTATNTYRHNTDNKEYHAMHTLGKNAENYAHLPFSLAIHLFEAGSPVSDIIVFHSSFIQCRWNFSRSTFIWLEHIFLLGVFVSCSTFTGCN